MEAFFFTRRCKSEKMHRNYCLYLFIFLIRFLNSIKRTYINLRMRLIMDRSNTAEVEDQSKSP